MLYFAFYHTMRIYRTCNCLQNHQLHLLLLLFPTLFPQTKTTKNLPTAGHQQPSYSYHLPKKKNDQRWLPRFFLHSMTLALPEEVQMIKHSQLERRENTEVCDVWLFDGPFVVESPLKGDRTHVCHVVFENIWWQIMRRNTGKNGKLLTKWLLIIGLDGHQ